MILTIIRARGWGVAVLALAASGVVASVAGEVPTGLPVSGVGTVVRLYVAALAPVAVTSALVDRFPDVSGSLPREGWLRRVGWACGIALPAGGLGWSWVVIRPTAGQVLFETTTLCVLLGVGLLLVRRGVGGVVGAASAGLCWLVAADGIAEFLGFPVDETFRFEDTVPHSSGPAWAGLAVTGAAVLWFVGLSVRELARSARNVPPSTP